MEYVILGITLFLFVVVWKRISWLNERLLYTEALMKANALNISTVLTRVKQLADQLGWEFVPDNVKEGRLQFRLKKKGAAPAAQSTNTSYLYKTTPLKKQNKKAKK